MKDEIIVFSDPRSPIAESFRNLRTNVQFYNKKNKSTVILLTSTNAGEGKSWVSSNLAAALAQSNQKVLLIDTDMRKGRQNLVWNIPKTPGLANYLTEKKIVIADCIYETQNKNLNIIPAGNIPQNPSELLSSRKFVDMIEKLRMFYKIIILDGTPCSLVTDSVILTKNVDYTLVVVACNSTKKKELQRTISSLKRVGGNINGYILNKLPVSSKKYEQSYYYSSEKKGKDLKW